jgi:hypothetical protein
MDVDLFRVRALQIIDNPKIVALKAVSNPHDVLIIDRTVKYFKMGGLA